MSAFGKHIKFLNHDHRLYQELERERRIEKEKAEGGPDPRVIEMDALGAQVAPRGAL